MDRHLPKELKSTASIYIYIYIQKQQVDKLHLELWGIIANSDISNQYTVTVGNK